MKNIYFYFYIGDDHWQIGKIIGSKDDIGQYPFELLISGFNPDEDFLWSAKFGEGMYVDDDLLNAPEKTDRHIMIELIFEDKSYWILNKWRNTRQYDI